MPPRSARLPLDTKHSRGNYTVPSRHPEREPENPHFVIRITNERIKLIAFLTISYITFNTTSEFSSYCITSECNHLIRVYEQFNWTVEYKHVNRVTAEVNIYLWHDKVLINKLGQQIIKLSFIKHLMRVINKNYDRVVKEILSEPIRRNPHTKVSFSIHLSPATRE